MLEVRYLVPLVGGTLFILMGVLLIVLRRRAGEGLVRGGQIPNVGNYPTMYAAGLGVGAVVCGAFMLALVIVTWN